MGIDTSRSPMFGTKVRYGMEQEGCRTTTIGKHQKVSAVLRIAVDEGNSV